MRRTLVFALAGLAACYNPDYSQKAVSGQLRLSDELLLLGGKTLHDRDGNPPTQSADLAPDTRPTRIEVLVSQTGSFWMGTGATDGFNDTPNYLRSIPAPHYLDEREVTVADYRACVTSAKLYGPSDGSVLVRRAGSVPYGAPAKTTTR